MNVRRNPKRGKELCKPLCHVCDKLRNGWPSFALSHLNITLASDLCLILEMYVLVKSFILAKNLPNVTVHEWIQAVFFLIYICTFEDIEDSLKVYLQSKNVGLHTPHLPALLTTYTYSAIYQDLEDEMCFSTEPETSVHTLLPFN